MLGHVWPWWVGLPSAFRLLSLTLPPLCSILWCRSRHTCVTSRRPNSDLASWFLPWSNFSIWPRGLFLFSPVCFPIYPALLSMVWLGARSRSVFRYVSWWVAFRFLYIIVYFIILLWEETMHPHLYPYVGVDRSSSWLCLLFTFWFICIYFLHRTYVCVKTLAPWRRPLLRRSKRVGAFFAHSAYMHIVLFKFELSLLPCCDVFLWFSVYGLILSKLISWVPLFCLGALFWYPINKCILFYLLVHYLYRAATQSP